MTVTAGVVALGGTAGLAWAVSPHPAAAPEATGQRLVETPAPVPPTLSRARRGQPVAAQKAVVRPAVTARRRTATSKPVTTTGGS